MERPWKGRTTPPSQHVPLVEFNPRLLQQLAVFLYEARPPVVFSCLLMYSIKPSISRLECVKAA